MIDPTGWPRETPRRFIRRHALRVFRGRRDLQGALFDIWYALLLGIELAYGFQNPDRWWSWLIVGGVLVFVLYQWAISVPRLVKIGKELDESTVTMFDLLAREDAGLALPFPFVRINLIESGRLRSAPPPERAIDG